MKAQADGQRLPGARARPNGCSTTPPSPTQVRDMKRANADIVAISAHPFTTCGVLKEMERQGVKPKLLIGLTSSSSIETLQGCAKQAEGIIIPTSFAPVTPEAKKAAENVAKFGGSADLHSAAAYEIMFILKDVIEQQKIMAKPDTVQADRDKMRQGLAGAEGDQGCSARSGARPTARRSSRSSMSTPRAAAGGPAQAGVLTGSDGGGLHRRPAAVRRAAPINRGHDVDLLDLIDAVQSVADGVLFGATYALLGIGFTLVFGVMHKINLSYAAASIGAAYASLLMLAVIKAPASLVFLMAAAAGGVIGALVYLVGFRFIPLANPLATLMSTVGAAAADRRDHRAHDRGRAAQLSGAVLRRDHPRRAIQPARRPDVRLRARLRAAWWSCCCCSTAPARACRRAPCRSSRSRRELCGISITQRERADLRHHRRGRRHCRRDDRRRHRHAVAAAVAAADRQGTDRHRDRRASAASPARSSPACWSAASRTSSSSSAA